MFTEFFPLSLYIVSYFLNCFLFQAAKVKKNVDKAEVRVRVYIYTHWLFIFFVNCLYREYLMFFLSCRLIFQVEMKKKLEQDEVSYTSFCYFCYFQHHLLK